MRMLLTVLLLLIYCPFVKGQEPSIWLSAEELETKGYFRNHGISSSKVVIGLALENKDSVFKERMLKLHNAHLNNVYLISPNKDTIYKTGDYLPFYSRPEYYWDFVLPIQTLGNSTDSFKLVFDNSIDPLFYNLKLYSKNEFQRIRSNENFLLGAILSFSIVFIIIFFLLGVFNKDKSRFIFSFFILCSTLWLYNINGVLFQLFWPENSDVQHASRPIFSSLTTASLIYYFITFYARYINSYARYVFNIFIAYIVLRALIVIFIPDFFDNPELNELLFFITTFIFISGILCFIVYLILLFRIKDVRLHSISITFYFIIAFKEIVKLIGVNLFYFGANDQQYSFIGHFIIMSLFSFANIQEYRTNRKRRLAEKIAEADERKRELNEKIFRVQENERNTIAKNIHDQVGGILAAMKIKLQTMKLRYEPGKDENELIQLLDNCNEELYKIIDDLHSPEFEERDLSIIIGERIEMISKATGISIAFNQVPLNIKEQTAIKIYRIICELLTNSIKHSGCSEISLVIEKSGDILNINYADNGIGMQALSNPNGRGVQNIKSRIAFLQGNMEVNSKTGETRYTINIPINKQDEGPINLHL